MYSLHVIVHDLQSSTLQKVMERGKFAHWASEKTAGFTHSNQKSGIRNIRTIIVYDKYKRNSISLWRGYCY